MNKIFILIALFYTSSALAISTTDTIQIGNQVCEVTSDSFRADFRLNNPFSVDELLDIQRNNNQWDQLCEPYSDNIRKEILSKAGKIIYKNGNFLKPRLSLAVQVKCRFAYAYNCQQK